LSVPESERCGPRRNKTLSEYEPKPPCRKKTPTKSRRGSFGAIDRVQRKAARGDTFTKEEKVTIVLEVK